MKWLQDNPLGMILASLSGLFALLALAIAIVWNLPVSVDTAGLETEAASGREYGSCRAPGRCAEGLPGCQ